MLGTVFNDFLEKESLMLEHWAALRRNSTSRLIKTLFCAFNFKKLIKNEIKLTILLHSVMILDWQIFILFFLPVTTSVFNDTILTEVLPPPQVVAVDKSIKDYYETHLTHDSICNRLKGLSPGQLKHCHLYEDHMKIVADGVRSSLQECQKHMIHQRWNCSLNSQHITFFGPQFNIGNKESAYLQAIISAGIMHAVARSCKDGYLTRCGCSTLPRPRGLSKDWIWKGCGDNLEYAYKFTRNLMDIKEQEKIHELNRDKKEYSRSLMTLHNNEAGRRAVLERTKIICKCHGVSGSCTLITCWHQLPPFVEIGEYVTNKYNSAIKVKKNRKGRLQIRNARGKKSTVTDLVFIHQSPNFCQKNNTMGILGTENRECNSNTKEPGSCDELCCGRGHILKKVLVKEKCNCKFHWCCYVKCDACSTPKEITTCK